MIHKGSNLENIVYKGICKLQKSSSLFNLDNAIHIFYYYF